MNELTTTDTRVSKPGRDGALDAALDRLVPGRLPDRPDNPDRHVTAVRRLPAVPAEFAPFPAGLDDRLRSALEIARDSRSSTRTRRRPIEHALAGRNVVVITPTASGKTLCYNAPVLHAILQDPSSRALYLFPTKALAQDQLAELQAMCETIDACHGRTDWRLHLRRRYAAGCAPHDPVARAPRAEQSRHAALRASCRTIRAGRSCSKTSATSSSTNCTRIAACSAAICATCCAGCAAICRHYGSNPVFLCSSATIANPRELAERLTEQPFELVEQKRRTARREVLRLRQSAGRESAARHPAFVSRAKRGGSPRSS